MTLAEIDHTKIVHIIAWRDGLVALLNDGTLLFGSTRRGLVTDMSWIRIPVPDSAELGLY